VQVKGESMTAWLRRFASQFDLESTFTREGRQEITLRYAVWFSILVLLTLLPNRVLEWSADRSNPNAFYVINNLACIVILLTTGWLNNTHKTRIASEIFIFLSSYLCFTAYPYQNADQVLLYLVIPVSIASFISDGRRSLRVILFVIPVFLLVYQVEFAHQPFPVFSVICLILVALISWRASKMIDQMVEQLVSAYDSTIEGWAQALEMRNQETEGHSHRVVELTMKLASKMRIPIKRLEHLRRGVLLHDIGKMGIPDSILCKHGPLTDAELTIMQEHPSYARDLLAPITYLSPAIQIPYCHHEKWDGTGYPRGLQGDAIPIEARIFSVVDVWDAMRSKRSYRDPIPETQVIEYLRIEKGRSFDPLVVDEFLQLLNAPTQPKEKPLKLTLAAPSQKSRT
jgi:HD-GYP domain-containing protein (c-di-GMP phosphodiesterase class II)